MRHRSHLPLPHPCAEALEQALAARLKQMLITINAEIKPRRISHFPYAFQIKPIPVEQGLIIAASREEGCCHIANVMISGTVVDA